MKIQLKDIVASPFRNFVINPLREEKIVALTESINTTGFWKNVRVRENDKGTFEIIVGHHRVETLRRAHPATFEIDVQVVKLTDAEVLQQMSRDHLEVFNHDLAGVVELVKATVQALATGAIKPGQMSIGSRTKDEHIRIAPSFLAGESSDTVSELRYTISSLSTFLALTTGKRNEPVIGVEAAVKALELIERRIWPLKIMDTFRRDGVISAREVLKAAKDKETQQALRADKQKRAADVANAKNEVVQRELQEKRDKAERERQAALARLKEAEQEAKDAETPSQEKRAEDAVEAARKAAEEAERTKQKLNDRIKYKKEQKERAQKLEEERAAKREEEDHVRWVNTVIGRVAKTYDNRSDVRFSVVQFTAKNAKITPEEKKRLVCELKALRDRVNEDIAKL